MDNEPALKITGDQVITGQLVIKSADGLVVDPEAAARIGQAVRDKLPND